MNNQVHKTASLVVARLTVIRQNGWRTIVEIREDATFMAFYRYYRQFGNKRSTKEFVRSSCRTECLSVINTHLQKPGLDVIEKRLKSFGAESNPVVSSKLQIMRKRAYKKMLSARPDELGLTTLTHTDLNAPKPIPVSVPSYDWVRAINRRALRRGAVR